MKDEKDKKTKGARNYYQDNQQELTEEKPNGDMIKERTCSKGNQGTELRHVSQERDGKKTNCEVIVSLRTQLFFLSFSGFISVYIWGLCAGFTSISLFFLSLSNYIPLFHVSLYTLHSLSSPLTTFHFHACLHHSPSLLCFFKHIPFHFFPYFFLSILLISVPFSSLISSSIYLNHCLLCVHFCLFHFHARSLPSFFFVPPLTSRHILFPLFLDVYTSVTVFLRVPFPVYLPL